MSDKLITIVIDGASTELIDNWISEGRLPNFRRIFNSGCRASLESEYPPLTFLNNPSMLTGKNAGRHGISNWLKLDRENNEINVIDETTIKSDYIWDMLEKSGKETIVINMPLTYPPRKINGIMISRSIVPPLEKNYTYPTEIEKELENKLGRYEVFQKEIYGEGKEEKFFKSVIKTLEHRIAASKYLMENKNWDLFILGISAVDAVQHAFWKFKDKKESGFSSYIFDTYKKIDAYLGELLEKWSDSARIMILSDHGAGSLIARSHMNNLLLKKGYLKLKRNLRTFIKYSLFRSGFTVQNVYRLAIMTGLVNYRKKMDPRTKRKSIVRKIFLSIEDIDWGKTRAFIFGTGGQLFLSPEPGESKEKLAESITKDLMNIKIPAGGRYIEKVLKREDMFWGENIAELADLFLIPSDPRYEESGDYEFYSNRIFDRVCGISCNHRMNALFVVTGLGLKKNFKLQKKIKMYDIAAIILSLLAAEGPSDLDGKKLEEIFDGT